MAIIDMSIDLVVLNYNGKELLAECLPSVVEAARRSRHPCRVAVIDNDSNDDSLKFLRAEYPGVAVFSRPNRGLCSYNDVLVELNGRVAVLLNNDIKLANDAVDPLVEPLLGRAEKGEAAGKGEAEQACFMAAPLCWLFDGRTYEGLKTAVGWRWGLVQATARFPGHEQTMLAPGLTASAGAVLAVDRAKFLELGGFDPLYLPGRLEDLDFAFRGYQAGYHARYVPSSVAYHRGQASFGPAFGQTGCQLLALRNTLLFQWKNLRHPWHIARHVAALGPRIALDWMRALRPRPGGRLLFTRALWQASKRLGACMAGKPRAAVSIGAERAFFERFSFSRMAHADRAKGKKEGRRRDSEGRPGSKYPLSQWYVRPAATWLAGRLSATAVLPWHMTLLGAVLASMAAALLVARPAMAGYAAVLVLLAWFCDRLDGALARSRRAASPRGAWLDANVDELVDLGLHVAAAAAAASAAESAWPWTFLVAFLFGKYLLMYGLAAEETSESAASEAPARCAQEPARPAACEHAAKGQPGLVGRWLRAAWHLPGNADVRVHLLVMAMAGGWLTAELAWIAVYYNVRWVVRYALVTRRLQGSEVGVAAG